MPVKILRVAALCPVLLAGSSLTQSPAANWRPSTRDSLISTPSSRLATRDSRLATISGHLTLLEKGDKQAEDVGQAVIWLSPKSPATPPPPVRAEINTADKEFSPHVLV